MDSTLIYDVTIEAVGEENLFRITWKDAEKKEQKSFINSLHVSEKEMLTNWKKASKQLGIGEALFSFLDGDNDTRYFSQVLDKASQLKKKPQINLRTCKETADWPFELIAKNDEFLLLEHIHLVRRVSDRGIACKVSPRENSLRLLFMACAPIDLESRLNYEQEEEFILEITRDLPIEMGVEDSGSLQGLQQRLVLKKYDIVHLSGHANIDNHSPFFTMEGDTGRNVSVTPDQLWNGALLENPPRLLFLSACRSGETVGRSGSNDIVSFTQLMVEGFQIPTVLGWGRSVKDVQANHGGKILYYELSRGGSILEAIQRARCEMQSKFHSQEEPAWPLLRLYSNGTPLTAIVSNTKHRKPKSRQTTHAYLANSRVKVLKEGFTGRRQQIQLSLKTLNEDYDKVGILLLGTGGLGKSCLTGKICERFPGHTVISHQGKLDDGFLEAALRKVFSSKDDEQGLRILEQKRAMTDKLADLCAANFKESNYILLLDGFEQNLEKTGSGQPGSLPARVAELLYALLYYLPYCGKMSHLVITSRFAFTLAHNDRDLVEDRLQKIWLTGFLESEVLQKVLGLKYIDGSTNPLMKDFLINAGSRNPLLLEQIDRIAGEIPPDDTARLEAAVKKTREDFIQGLGLYELYQQCSEPLKRILERLSIYSKPVTGQQIPRIEEVTGIAEVKNFLQEGMNLSLVEHDQVKGTYSLTPLLK